MSHYRPDDGNEALGRFLSEAFDAKARADFPDHQQPPAMRMPDHLAPRRTARHARERGHARWLAPLATAAAVLVVVAVVLGLTSAGPDRTTTGAIATGTRSSATHSAAGQSSTSASASTSTHPAKPTGKPVHVSLKFGDGQTLGVGIPIIAFLSRPITDARAFAKATRVTVNGHRVTGGWYFERKFGDPGHPVEADFRLASYWPGHAHIHMDLPVKGVSAGPGLVFDDDLTLDFATGRANILTVDNASHKLTVVSDGKVWGTFPVSLGAPNTRTKRGTKVIMEKGNSICMSGPGYHECGVRYTQRLTYDGEYLHAAPWNIAHIEHGVNSSNGCTNLLPNDAKRLFKFLEIGDVVKYPNADGQLMQIGDGYGDWNIPWPQWQSGGLYRVS
jgi:lipoprotein-anchoring transpeptidase ErfK/SrfK